MPKTPVAAAEPTPAASPLAPNTPAYWDEARKHLSKRDRVLKKLMPKFGDASLQSRGDAFTTLARSIVGQQISVKAAQSVWERFAATVGDPAMHLKPPGVLVMLTRRSVLIERPLLGSTPLPSDGKAANWVSP